MTPVDTPPANIPSKGLEKASAAKNAIWDGVSAIFRPGCIVELRCLNTKQRTLSGYFNDGSHLAKAAYDLDKQGVPGVYVTLNPVAPPLLARAPNQMVPYARETTQDSHIVKRTRLLIDFDAKRPPGISATDAEHEAAIDRAYGVRKFLCDRGWRPPLVIDSGNGAHLIFEIDTPNDRDATTQVQKVLKALASRFDDDVVEVDQTVHNAARIVKLPGTMARKGFDMPDRPIGVREFSSDLATSVTQMRSGVVTAEQMQSLIDETEARDAASGRKSEPTNALSQFDLDDFLARNMSVKRGPEAHDGGERWIVHCPFNADHGGTSAAIIRMPSGAIVFKCQHNGCRDRRWADVRESYDPNYRERRPGIALPHGLDRDIKPNKSAPPAQIVLRRLCDIEAKPTLALWNNRVFAGEPCVIADVPGVGKGFVAGAIAAAITRGTPPPGGGDITGPGDVIVLSLEDDPARVLRPRYEALGVDLERVHILDGVCGSDERIAPFTLRHIELLERALELHPDVRAIIIDPISSMLAGSDIFRSNEVRERFDPFLNCTSERDVAVIMNTHTNKSTTLTGAFRVEGSLGGFVGRARSVLAVGLDPDTGVRGVGLLKSNLGRLDVPVVSFEIDAMGRFLWVGETNAVGAADLFDQQGGEAQHADATDAREAILAALTGGETSAGDLAKAVRLEGVADVTFRRARAKLRREGVIERLGGGVSGPVRWRRITAPKSTLAHSSPQNLIHNDEPEWSPMSESGGTDSEEVAESDARPIAGAETGTPPGTWAADNGAYDL